MNLFKLIKNLFSKSNSQEVSNQEDEISFIDKITNPEFSSKYPDFLERYISAKKHKSLYCGDINYIQDKNGKTYFKDTNQNNWFCDYDYKKPSSTVLQQMIKETTFTPEELEEELK